MSTKLRRPRFLGHKTLPAYVKDAAREACDEVFAMDDIPLDVRQNVGQTRAVLILLSWKYYDGEPEVTDSVFDAAYRYLQIREMRYPKLVTPLSPTQRVGKVMDKRGVAQRSERPSDTRKGAGSSPASPTKRLDESWRLLNR